MANEVEPWLPHHLQLQYAITNNFLLLPTYFVNRKKFSSFLLTLPTPFDEYLFTEQTTREHRASVKFRRRFFPITAIVKGTCHVKIRAAQNKIAPLLFPRHLNFHRGNDAVFHPIFFE